MLSYGFKDISLDPYCLSGDDSVEIISSEHIDRGLYYENALQGISRMPLLPHVRNAVVSDLQFPDHRSLYRLINPTIVVHTFSPGDTRAFIITNNGNLLEKDNFWLRYFQFVKLNGKSGIINTSLLDASEEIISDCEYVWCPDDPNFTHLTIDMLAPLAFFSNKHEFINSLPFAHFSDTPAWQLEYLKHFGKIEKLHLHHKSKQNFLVFKPRLLYFPVMTSTIDRTITMREFLRMKSWYKQIQYTGDIIPIFLSRNDSRAIRVRNAESIKMLVQRYGGFSIDPSNLTIEKKLELFSLPAVFIAEGSATNNIALFGLNSTRLINLVDKAIIHNDCFIRSGWPYLHFMSLRTHYIIGQETQFLAGSPLASNVFDLDVLEQTINNARFN